LPPLCPILSHLRLILATVSYTRGGVEKNMVKRKVSGYLSKSMFIRGHQCLKSLWLHKYRPELKEEADEALEARFRTGHEVGALAQQLFPGGVEVPYDGLTHAEQLAMTQKLLAEGKETIYEATFEHDGVFVKVDILHRGAAGWEILEVKGTTEVKEYHYFDTAIQLYVLAGSGLKIAKVALFHIDKRYKRRGAIDVQKLFAIEDITAQVREMQPNIAPALAEMRTMLAGEMPAIDIGPHCSDPYDCDFHGHCWGHIPEDSVFDLRERGVDKFALYAKRIVRQADIPLDTLNRKQRQQVESTIKQCDTLGREDVRTFLSSLWYPLCFLDFETVNPAIPLFDDSLPYQKIPFQYSLDVQMQEGGELQHHEFLALPGVDPRRALTDGLIAQIPAGACIIAWNQGFETGVLGSMAGLFPDLAPRIEKMIEGFRDPMTLFRDRTVYLWQQKGSYSIKAVLPALVPELSYDGLDVADGDMAMGAYYDMCATQDPQEVARIRKALLEYCGLDTMAMVRIVEKLRKMAV